MAESVDVRTETSLGAEALESGGGLIRLKITSALASLGVLGGAVSGVALTYLGNVISGYSVTPGLGVYAWNAGIMAGLGAVFGPPIAWIMLRRVPLWRTLTEPAIAGLLGSVLAMMFLPEPLFPIAVPGAIFASAGRLAYVYREMGPKTPVKEFDPPEGVSQPRLEKEGGGSAT